MVRVQEIEAHYGKRSFGETHEVVFLVRVFFTSSRRVDVIEVDPPTKEWL